MSTQASGLLDTLRRVQVTGHQQYGSVEVFHLRWPGSNGLDYFTLDESLEARWIEITEFNEAGQVPRIKIVNRSQHMVFLMAGEQLVGCKQNRVVNASIMVPANSEMPLPVTCVERGRWGYSGPVFTSAHSSSHHQLRVMMAHQAAMSYRQTGMPSADQAAVWREVSRKLGTMGSKSSSDALQDVFQDNDRKLKESVEQLPAPAACNGVVFVIGGRIAGADLFDKPETLCKLWPKLIKSCTIDALESLSQNPESTTREAIKLPVPGTDAILSTHCLQLIRMPISYRFDVPASLLLHSRCFTASRARTPQGGCLDDVGNFGGSTKARDCSADARRRTVRWCCGFRSIAG